MPLPAGEPDSPSAVAAWLERHAQVDQFERVRRQSEDHRAAHSPGCTVYPTSSGPLLGVLAAATRPRRVLESGCGLGYSALCLADGAGPRARVETIERDPLHADLADRNFTAAGLDRRITVLAGAAVGILRTLDAPYDMIFCDSDPEDYPEQLDEFLRLLSLGGLLVTSNLFLGQYTPDLPGAPAMAAYRERILSDERLVTTFLRDGLAISLRRDG